MARCINDVGVVAVVVAVAVSLLDVVLVIDVYANPCPSKDSPEGRGNNLMGDEGDNDGDSGRLAPPPLLLLPLPLPDRDEVDTDEDE